MSQTLPESNRSLVPLRGNNFSIYIIPIGNLILLPGPDRWSPWCGRIAISLKPLPPPILRPLPTKTLPINCQLLVTINISFLPCRSIVASPQSAVLQKEKFARVFTVDTICQASAFYLAHCKKASGWRSFRVHQFGVLRLFFSKSWPRVFKRYPGNSFETGGGERWGFPAPFCSCSSRALRWESCSS